MTEEINFYSSKPEYGWLSNFWLETEFVDAKEYATNEHFYQSQKTLDRQLSEWIRAAPSPYAAMKAGHALRPEEFRPDWEQVKVEVMLTGLRAKFQQNLDLKAKLLATGDAILHEDSKTDLFWGKKGQDMLGKLLMTVREEIREGRSP